MVLPLLVEHMLLSLGWWIIGNDPVSEDRLTGATIIGTWLVDEIVPERRSTAAPDWPSSSIIDASPSAIHVPEAKI